MVRVLSFLDVMSSSQCDTKEAHALSTWNCKHLVNSTDSVSLSKFSPMAHVNHNMKNKGAFARNGGKDRQANTRAGALKPGSALNPKEHKVDGSVEGQAGAAFKDKGTFARNGGKYNQANQRPGAVNKQKRKWVPEHKVFEGSVGEGQGFAFRRKQKVQHEYNKLLRKERRKHAAVRTQYRDEYPDHLSHLYKAEAEKLYDDARTSRIKRTQCRMGVVVEEVLEEDAPAEPAVSTDAAAEPHVSTDRRDPDTEQQGEQPAVTPDQTDSATAQTQRSTPSEAYSLPMSNRQKKKLLKKTSFQKTKEEFESIQEKRAKKKEEFLKDKQQREEAIQKYKQKKKEAFKVLNTKTKKGQPNLNVQMEYLLQKIQGTGK